MSPLPPNSPESSLTIPLLDKENISESLQFNQAFAPDTERSYRGQGLGHITVGHAKVHDTSKFGVL
jgi:hypothetical protein